MKLAFMNCGILCALLVSGCQAQEFPSKILGYKVQKASALVTTEDLDPTSNADIQIGLREMSVSHVGMLGATVNINADMLSKIASGKVDRLMFRDLTVNGVAIDVDDVTDEFSFQNEKTYRLEKSLHAHLSPANAIKAGFSQITDGSDQWSVAGTMFVFCKVKKFGFTFKRVVPIKLDFRVKNPLL